MYTVFKCSCAKRRSLLRLGLGVTAGLTLIPIGALSQAVNNATGSAKDVDAQIARHYASVEGLYKDIHASPAAAVDTPFDQCRNDLAHCT